MSNKILTLDASQSNVYASQYTTLTTATTVPTSKVLVSNTTTAPIVLARGLGASSPYDPDAQIGFTNAPITNTSEKVAINNAIVALKAAGQWSLLNVMAPVAGPTLSSSLWDFKRQVRMTAVNSPAYSVIGGWGFDGGTQYINTNFNTLSTPGTLFAEDEGHMLYATSDFATNPSGGVMGASDGSLETQFYLDFDLGYLSINQPRDGGFANPGGADWTPMILCGVRFQTSFTHTYMNGEEVGSDETAPSFDVTDGEIYVGALNTSGSADIYYFGPPICAITLGSGDINVATVTSIINTMNAALGRQVP